ncbi:MAG: zinc ABC transporter solute-binding protein [Chlorobiaceae bacterium]|nr:zinc ABC transporter solute-binding protein [Chlorobiaceae bacterium]
MDTASGSKVISPIVSFRILNALLLLLIMINLQGCSRVPTSRKIQVVASIEPLAYFVDRVGGDRVSVSVMVPPGGNPHSYEPTPKQMERLGRAALFVKAGSGVEFELDWMHRFLDLNRTLAVCDASTGAPLIPMTISEEEHEEPSGTGSHRHGQDDPHFWLTPRNARTIAANVERSLSTVDPVNRTYYAANRAVLDKELQELDAEIRERLSGLKNRHFLVFHPAWGYYAGEYGLEQIAAEAEGKTLTPVQMTKVIEKARAERIRVVFVSPQFSTTQAEAIARDIGGVTVMVDPLSRDYQQNLRKATTAFVRSMR